MNFAQNHKLHFIITLVVMIFITVFIGYRQYALGVETRNTNRLISGKLIVQALENYFNEFEKYPEFLEEIEAFISPIPVDPQTQLTFEYQKMEESFVLTIPQENGESIKIKK